MHIKVVANSALLAWLQKEQVRLKKLDKEIADKAVKKAAKEAAEKARRDNFRKDK